MHMFDRGGTPPPAYLVGPVWALLIGFVIVIALRLCSAFLGWETRPARIGS